MSCIIHFSGITSIYKQVFLVFSQILGLTSVFISKVCRNGDSVPFSLEWALALYKRKALTRTCNNFAVTSGHRHLCEYKKALGTVLKSVYDWLLQRCGVNIWVFLTKLYHQLSHPNQIISPSPFTFVSFSHCFCFIHSAVVSLDLFWTAHGNRVPNSVQDFGHGCGRKKQ